MSNSRPFYPELTFAVSPPRYNYPPRQVNNYNNRPFNITPRTHPNQGNPTYYNSRPNYNYQSNNNFGIRPQQQLNQGFNNRFNLPPKPPVPMDVDRSLHSRQINYQNRPVNNQNNFAPKRPLSTQQVHPPNKLQRTYHTDTVAPDTNNYQIQADPNENEYIEGDTIHFLD